MTKLNEMAEEYAKQINVEGCRVCAIDGYAAGYLAALESSEEVKELKAERDAYAVAMAIALRDGIFADKAQVKREIEEVLKPFRKMRADFDKESK